MPRAPFMPRRFALVASAALAVTVLVAAGARAASADTSSAAPSLVFVLAGQSNMAGAGSLPKKPESDSRLLVWTGKKWKMAKDPLPLPRPNDTRGVGPGMTFGLTVVKSTGQTVGLIQCSADGSSIVGWQPGRDLFESCIARARAAGGTIGGVLFLEGESEAQSAGQAAGWLPGFQTMLAGFRRDLPGAWPFLLGQIGSLDHGQFPAQQAVRDAQAQATGVALVTTADLPMKDGKHFTVGAYQEIGRRFAAALLGYPIVLPSSTPPAISSFEPTSGPVGTTVTIIGSGFTGATAVQFNGTYAQSYTVDSDQQITAVVATGTTSGKVSVTAPGGTATGSKFEVSGSSGSGKALKITKVNPSRGSVGTTVEITGSGFTGATAVQFNGTNATAYTVDSDGQITAVVPQGATSGKVSVTTPAGTVTGAKFQVEGPKIKKLKPSEGPVGTTVVIQGSGFTGATAVQFNGTDAASFSVDSDQQITAVVAAGTTSGKVSVTAPGGTVTGPRFKVT